MNKRALAVLFSCFGTVFAAYAIRYSYGTLLPEMLTTLSITKAQAGIIYSSYFIAYTVLSPILGVLADRHDIKIILSVFVVLMGAGAFLMQYPHSVMQASLFFSLAGIGCAACWAPVMAVAQRWTSDKRRGMSLALIDVGSTLGVMAAGSLIPLAVLKSSWQTAWMGLGILGLTLGIIDFLLIRSHPGPAENPSPAKPDGRDITGGSTYKKLFDERRFWLIGLAYMMTGFAIMVPFTFLSTYAVQELSFSFSSAGMLVTVIGIGGLAGKLTLGPISDKSGRIRIMLLCSALITAGCLGMVYNRGWSLVIMTAVFGTGYGACWSMYAACASDFFSKQSAGGIIGIWTFYLGIGLLASPIISGWIADITGTLMWSFIVAAGAGTGSFLLLIPMLKSKPIALSKMSSRL
jgi:MFS family permease